MITVVSGLPRSGTSLMMRMLEAGGLPVLSDGIREADIDNPNGYYEFEPVKQLAKDVSWLQDAEGKAVKIISSLLRDLPSSRRYKVIFMERKLEEILASQRDMMRRRGTSAESPDEESLRRSFSHHIEEMRAWLPRQSHMDVLHCEYEKLIGNPRSTARAVARFLNLRLDLRCMAQVVDPSLYRHRA